MRAVGIAMLGGSGARRNRNRPPVAPSIYRASSAKRRSPGLVNFVTAIAYNFCLDFRTAFTQPGDNFLAETCIPLFTCLGHTFRQSSMNVPRTSSTVASMSASTRSGDSSANARSATSSTPTSADARVSVSRDYFYRAPQKRISLVV